MGMVRKAHCAHWYPSELKEVESYKIPSLKKISAQISFAIVPHAGWVYSGKVAGKVYSMLREVDTAIYLATNHTGLGPSTSVYPDGEWETSFGSVKIDDTFTKKLLEISSTLQADKNAHLQEHAIEVQIPFLQTSYPKAKIVPIEMRDYSLQTCQEIGQAIEETIHFFLKNKPKERFWVIASTDMTHVGESYGYFPSKDISLDQYCRKQDSLAIDLIHQLDAKGLLRAVKEKNITMCGAGPAAALLETAKRFNAKKGNLIDYATSCDVSGKDSKAAVGYAGIILE